MALRRGAQSVYILRFVHLASPESLGMMYDMAHENEEAVSWLEKIPHESRADAEERLRQYLAIALRIFARLEAEEAERTLTVVEYGPSVSEERSNKPNPLKHE